jgi:GntR family transcriptional regulator/MocR family aminotransferase
VKDGRSESELVELAARKGVRVYPTADTWTSTAPADWDYVMIGYAGIPLDDIEPGIAALAHAWFG